MEKKAEPQPQAATPAVQPAAATKPKEEVPKPAPAEEKPKEAVKPAAPEQPPKEASKEEEKPATADDSQMNDFMSNFETFMKDPRNKGQMKRLQEMAPLYQKHAFWDTQPVVHLAKEKEVPKAGVLEAKEVKDVRPTPLSLPEGFEWCDIKLEDDKEMQEVFELLRDNYVEDTDAMFRFKYSIPFLRWALTAPNAFKDWIMGVRVIKNKKLVGFITGIPVTVFVGGQKMTMAEINFLCVHKKLRTKRLAPVLIKEVTRRVNLKNIWQAIYTAGKYIPTPFAEALYYHRSLNVKKLVDIGFCGIPPKSNLKRQERINKLPDKVEIPGFRRMVKKDAKQVRELLNNYLKQFKIYPELSLAEVKHFLIPREGVVDSYVVEETVGSNKVLTDFVSFYTLPSSVLKHESVHEMKAAYAYYYASTKQPINKLMKAALILAKKADHDVFNCLDIMENKKFVEELGFGPGNGNLMFYLYNFAAPSMTSEDLGMVLV